MSNKTKIEDVIEPEVFEPYMMQKTVENSAFIQSGVATSDPGLIIPRGGRVVYVPFWKNLNSEDEEEILSDTTPMSTSKMETGEDVAAVHLRCKAWAANDLASILAGSNAMNAIGDKTADYWIQRMERTLIHSLKGVFKADSMKGSLLDISAKDGAAGIISNESMIDASSLLGDRSNVITAIAMHSAVHAFLRKLDLIEYEKPSDGSARIAYYQEKRVIIDDTLTPTKVTHDTSVSTNAYPIFFFGAGAISYNEGNDIIRVETDRDKLAGDDFLITRRQFIMHPRGVKWKGSPSGTTPSNTELEEGTNWERVDELKNIPITMFVARLTNDASA